MLSRLLYSSVVGVAYLLLFNRDTAPGWLDGSFASQSAAAKMLGTLLTAAGLGFCVWARIHLGRNWSGSVRIRQDHELIRSGPYARIRHPIYSGLLLATMGTVLVVGRFRGIVALVIAGLGFAYKAMGEERLLAREFGPAFDDHRRRTGFFLPRILSKDAPSVP